MAQRQLYRPERNTELYIRWMQFGVFNPLSRAHHEGDNAVEPWMFGPEAEQICKQAIELKYQLFPYIYSYAREAHETGMPLMRALLLEYPDDAETFNAEGEFLFGKELLIAPVTTKGTTTKRIYLPEGEWIDFNDKKTVYSGKEYITYNAPLHTIPVLVKKGSIIPMMPVMQYIHEIEDYPVSFELFPASENQTASFELYEDDGESLDYQANSYSKTMIECRTTSSEYHVVIRKPENTGYQTPENRNWILKMYLDEKPKTVEYQETTSLEWLWDEKQNVCISPVPDTKEMQSVKIIKD